MKKLLYAIPLAALCGCFTQCPKVPVNWTVSLHSDEKPAAIPPRFGYVKASLVTVRAPFDGTRIAVLRPDGSIAFDGLNVFASVPASLLRGAVSDALAASGEFKGVVDPTSSGGVSLTAEVTVTRLALDCTREERRDATVALSLTLLDGRRIVSVKNGDGKAPAMSGNYTEAFSTAFLRAMEKALAEALKDAESKIPEDRR